MGIPQTPWSSTAEWLEASQSLDHLIGLHERELKKARSLARNIATRLESIFPLIDELCRVTCPFCPDPCCLVAKVYFDFPDLLFFHLTGQPIPEDQLRHTRQEVCRFLGPRGCTLSRSVRPWACTRYMCPPQMTVLRKRDPGTQAFFNDAIQAIKVLRQEMESEFICSTTLEMP